MSRHAHGTTSLRHPMHRHTPRGARSTKARGAAACSAVAMLATGAIIGLPGTAAAAAGPDRIRVDISEEFTDDFLTQACGTPVVGTAEGTVEITLWRDAAGLVVRELDRYPGVFFTWTAPGTGQSVKTRYNVGSMWEYPGGAVEGGPVIVTSRGLFFHIPGATSALAGREVSVGDVDFFEDGLPIVEDGETVSLVGHWPEFDVASALCQALTR
jgi:hypothetical protein